ncbi:unnamed protein product [Hermetia illucens]|uniref:Uncharacterized protein n=1 Tax=Hermetia illucens TaxID=343691 RepID=A0A7R8V8B1_HERIL|nr:unnamed protein product [Hermetia illucens]
MEKKRPLTQNEMEYYANLSDSEFDEMLDEDDNDSSDYEPSDNSSDSEDMVVSDCEVDPEPEDNNDDSQTTTSNANDDDCGQKFNKILNYLFSKKILV